ncbi:MAG TPA: thiamine phosphate synthase [Candidatus Dormibacteraeota bacterium]|nr:thiamine phosphate synthase [Candidatus Dormibacteraeota bacterium]
MTRAKRLALLTGIYAIVNEGPRALAIARAALAAEITVIQYRAKDGIDPERLQALVALAHQHAALLLLNDNWTAAREYDCDGVHLGPGDDGFDDPVRVRATWPDAVIGLSTGTAAEAMVADGSAVDYLGVGPIFSTKSKADAGAPIGLAGLHAIRAVTQLPICAIGGIDAARIASVRTSGAAMAAVIAALASPENPQVAAAELVAAWNDTSQ